MGQRSSWPWPAAAPLHPDTRPARRRIVGPFHPRETPAGRRIVSRSHPESHRLTEESSAPSPRTTQQRRGIGSPFHPRDEAAPARIVWSDRSLPSDNGAAAGATAGGCYSSRWGVTARRVRNLPSPRETKRVRSFFRYASIKRNPSVPSRHGARVAIRSSSGRD